MNIPGPSDEVLRAALLGYASKGLKADVRIANLKSDLNYSIRQVMNYCYDLHSPSKIGHTKLNTYLQPKTGGTEVGHTLRQQVGVGLGDHHAGAFWCEASIQRHKHLEGVLEVLGEDKLTVVGAGFWADVRFGDDREGAFGGTPLINNTGRLVGVIRQDIEEDILTFGGPELWTPLEAPGHLTSHLDKAMQREFKEDTLISAMGGILAGVGLAGDHACTSDYQTPGR
ncbi:hypothetical protein K438DRAFT_1763840 [Mycena galopus ATCC 62051]|nr:hypothetical protein K438DRAFT_1763840 [Mycena galopus ATCC 62051]